MRIGTKLLAGTAGVVGLFGVVVLSGLQQGVSRLLTEELGRRGMTIAETLAWRVENALLTENALLLREMLHEDLANHQDLRYIFVLDRSGKVASQTLGAGLPEGLREANVLGPGMRSTSRSILTEEGRILDVALSLPLEGMGIIRVGMSERGVTGRARSLMAVWGGGAAVILIMGMGFVWWTTKRISSRLRGLVRMVEAVGRGDHSVRAQPEGKDELDKLSRAFNAMVRDLDAYQAQVVRTGKLAAIGELASTVAHEINNPLNTMSVCSQALIERSGSAGLRGHEDFADFPEYLNTIDAEILRCKKVTSGLLLFGHPRPPQRIPIDLNGLIEETLALLAHRAGADSVVIERALDPGLPTVAVDPDQIKQVLINVLENALDHLGAGGRVRVSTGTAGRKLVIEVKDDGPGIPAEHLGRVFDLFFTTKRSGKGSGLGLAICRKIVEAHGGSIAAASGPGKGAVFTIVLPLT